jgi:hypothetical protein
VTVAEAVTLIGALTAAIVSIASAVATLRQSAKIDTVHLLVNSQSIRMERLAERAGAASRAQLELEGELPTNIGKNPDIPDSPGGGRI